MNAFNPHEDGHAESLAILAAIQQGGDPVVVPTLLLPEIASAVARASDDTAGALQYTSAANVAVINATVPTCVNSSTEAWLPAWRRARCSTTGRNARISSSRSTPRRGSVDASAANSRSLGI